ncbi:MAG: hypothetical protein QW587_05585 [Candidatus Bathyarchaeia archaeon]
MAARPGARRPTSLGESFQCDVCGRPLPDNGVLTSILVETPLATGSRHFCSMEHLIQYAVSLREGGSPLYEMLHERERPRGRERLTLKGLLERIEELEGMVMEAVKKKVELEERLKALEEEKAALLAEIEALKALPELQAKVSALESEVAQLKEEKKTLEERAASPPLETLPPPEEKPPT